MAHGARLGSVVMFVQNLDRSVSFYLDVLALEVADQSRTAALLISGDGSRLILRAMGSNASHALGRVGDQDATWTAAGKEGLRRSARLRPAPPSAREYRRC